MSKFEAYLNEGKLPTPGRGEDAAIALLTWIDNQDYQEYYDAESADSGDFEYEIPLKSLEKHGWTRKALEGFGNVEMDVDDSGHAIVRIFAAGDEE